MENQNVMQDSLDSLVKQKKTIQLREHFSWFVWAVAQYYFGAPSRSPTQQVSEQDSHDSNQFRSRVTIPNQDISISEHEDTFTYQNSSQSSIHGGMQKSQKQAPMKPLSQQRAKL